MIAQWRQVMRSAISEVLETMFFVMVDFNAHEPAPRTYCCGSRICLAGDERNIEITFRTTEPFARMIAANFLAKEEEEVTREELEDVVKELANMVGGDYIGRLEGEKWQLGIPSFLALEGEETDTASGLLFSFMGDPAGMASIEAESSQSKATTC